MSTSQSQQSVEKLLLKKTETYQKISSTAKDISKEPNETGKRGRPMI